MFREFVKEQRSEGRRVCINLTGGRYILGVIVNHGPEAMLVQTGPSDQVLVMKQAVESIRPATDRKPARKKEG